MNMNFNLNSFNGSMMTFKASGNSGIDTKCSQVCEETTKHIIWGSAGVSLIAILFYVASKNEWFLPSMFKAIQEQETAEDNLIMFALVQAIMNTVITYSIYFLCFVLLGFSTLNAAIFSFLSAFLIFFLIALGMKYFFKPFAERDVSFYLQVSAGVLAIAGSLSFSFICDIPSWPIFFIGIAAYLLILACYYFKQSTAAVVAEKAPAKAAAPAKEAAPASN